VLRPPLQDQPGNRVARALLPGAEFHNISMTYFPPTAGAGGATAAR
jgi:hypothetical protein